MIDITTTPNHGQRLINKDRGATTSFQLFLDSITISLNADRAGLKSYTVATVPPAKSGYGTIMVTDESGGAVVAFSDLTDWRRTTDRAIIS